MKAWFDSLAAREQKILMLGVLALVIYIFVQVLLSAHDGKVAAEKKLSNALETHQWVSDAVTTIKSSSGGGVARQMRGKSLIQISELAAARSGIRSTRFQPSGDSEAQIWFEEVPFSALMQYVSRMEQDGGVNVQSVSLNSAKVEGLVNARMKFSK